MQSVQGGGDGQVMWHVSYRRDVYIEFLWGKWWKESTSKA